MAQGAVCFLGAGAGSRQQFGHEAGAGEQAILRGAMVPGALSDSSYVFAFTRKEEEGTSACFSCPGKRMGVPMVSFGKCGQGSVPGGAGELLSFLLPETASVRTAPLGSCGLC